jgi:hypothetical protein
MRPGAQLRQLVEVVLQVLQGLLHELQKPLLNWSMRPYWPVTQLVTHWELARKKAGLAVPRHDRQALLAAAEQVEQVAWQAVQTASPWKKPSGQAATHILLVDTKYPAAQDSQARMVVQVRQGGWQVLHYWLASW